MPITSSAIKAARQSEQRRERRLAYRTRMRTFIRKVKDLAKEGKTEEAGKALATAYKAIDMAAKKSIIHWKNAARKKALLARLVAVKGK